MANQLRQRTLKSGEVRLYSGRKIATKEDKKQFYKANPDFDTKGLSKEDRQYFGRLKGGIKRVEKAGTRIDGKFIEGKYDRAAQKLKNLGFDLDGLLKAKGYKSLDQLFKEMPDVKTSLEAIMSGVGLHNWYSPDNAVDIIKDYLGNDIIVNGQKVSANKAVHMLINTEAALKEVYDHFRSAVRLSFEGTDRLIMNLPEVEELDSEDDDVGEFNSQYGNEQTGMYQLYKSNPVKK